MKIIITESQYNKAIDAYISYLIEPHEVITDKQFPDSIFWVKGNETIVQIEDLKYFWLRHDIWKDISRMFELEYKKTKSIMKTWLENHNLGELTPDSFRFRSGSPSEQHYNLG